VRAVGILEFHCNGLQWIRAGNISLSGETLDAVIGAGQNDGANRRYFGRRMPNGVGEATFEGESWQVATVADIGGLVSQVRVGDARGDGINRVYASSPAGLYQLTHQ